MKIITSILFTLFIVTSICAQPLSPSIDCNGNIVFLFSKFYYSTCAKTCYKLTIKKGKPVFEFVQKKCGESCCEKTTAYCWNTLTNMVEVSNTTKTSIGLCSGEVGPPIACPTGYFPLSNRCERPCL